MRYSFLSPHYWKRNRDRKIKKIAQGHSLSKRQNCNLNLVNTTSGYYAILLLYSKRINNGRYFHSAAHSCKYFSILELLVSITLWGVLIFCLLLLTLSMLPDSVLCLESLWDWLLCLWFLVCLANESFQHEIRSKVMELIILVPSFLGCCGLAESLFKDHSFCLFGLLQTLSLGPGRSFLILSIRCRGGEVSLLLLAQGCSVPPSPQFCTWSLHWSVFKLWVYHCFLVIPILSKVYSVITTLLFDL